MVNVEHSFASPQARDPSQSAALFLNRRLHDRTISTVSLGTDADLTATAELHGGLLGPGEEEDVVGDEDVDGLNRAIDDLTVDEAIVQLQGLVPDHMRSRSQHALTLETAMGSPSRVSPIDTSPYAISSGSATPSGSDVEGYTSDDGPTRAPALYTPTSSISRFPAYHLPRSARSTYRDSTDTTPSLTYSPSISSISESTRSRNSWLSPPISPLQSTMPIAHPTIPTDGYGNPRPHYLAVINEFDSGYSPRRLSNSSIESKSGIQFAPIEPDSPDTHDYSDFSPHNTMWRQSTTDSLRTQTRSPDCGPNVLWKQGTNLDQLRKQARSPVETIHASPAHLSMQSLPDVDGPHSPIVEQARAQSRAQSRQHSRDASHDQVRVAMKVPVPQSPEPHIPASSSTPTISSPSVSRFFGRSSDKDSSTKSKKSTPSLKSVSSSDDPKRRKAEEAQRKAEEKKRKKEEAKARTERLALELKMKSQAHKMKNAADVVSQMSDKSSEKKKARAAWEEEGAMYGSGTPIM